VELVELGQQVQMEILPGMDQVEMEMAEEAEMVQLVE